MDSRQDRKQDHDQDKDLEAFLNGRDRFPGLPDRGAGEEPPPRLDAAILGAAREAVRERPWAARRRAALSMAASLFLFTAAVLLLFPAEGPVPGSGAGDAAEALNALSADAPAAAREPRQVANAGGTAAPAPRRVEAERESTALEEIVITGSRIARDIPVENASFAAPPEYRASARAWAAEIHALIEAGRMTDAEAERGLFRQRHPDLDLETLLQAVPAANEARGAP